MFVTVSGMAMAVRLSNCRTPGKHFQLAHNEVSLNLCLETLNFSFLNAFTRAVIAWAL